MFIAIDRFVSLLEKFLRLSAVMKWPSRHVCKFLIGARCLMTTYITRLQALGETFWLWNHFVFCFSSEARCDSVFRHFSETAALGSWITSEIVLRLPVLHVICSRPPLSVVEFTIKLACSYQFVISSVLCVSVESSCHSPGSKVTVRLATMLS